jgi:hypothetical protein
VSQVPILIVARHHPDCRATVPMNFLLVLMVLLVIVLTYMTRHGGYGP